MHKQLYNTINISNKLYGNQDHKLSIDERVPVIDSFLSQSSNNQVKYFTDTKET